jgi:hypothetical protein
MPLERVNVRRSLRFLNFGEPLHDELIEGWLPQRDEPLKLNVTYFDDHHIWKYTTPGLYLLRISVIDPADTLTDPEVEDRALKVIACAATYSKPERLPPLIQNFKEKMICALEADVRWLRAQLTARMKLEALKLQNGQWTRVGAEEVAAILNPMAHERDGVPRAEDLCVSENNIKAAERELNRLRAADEATVQSTWSNRLPEFDCALQARLMVVQEEAQDAVTLAREEVKNAEEALEAALDRGNRLQIFRAENIRDVAKDTYRMVEVLWQQRESWLRDLEQDVLAVQPEEQLICLLNARKAE